MGPKGWFVGAVLAACTVGSVGAMAVRSHRREAVELRVKELIRVRGGQSVPVLVEKAGARRLPVPVTKVDAALIERALNGRRGLTTASVEALGGRIVRASIDEVSGERVFRGHLSLAGGLREMQLEARAGEALALALSAGAPIVADPSVLEEAGVSPDDLRGKSARGVSASSEPAP